MLGIQRGATNRVRCDDRCLAYFIRRRQLSPQLPGLSGHHGCFLTLADRLTQLRHTLLQCLALRALRQRTDQTLQHPQEFKLLTVLRRVYHLPCLNGCRVIGANVIE